MKFIILHQNKLVFIAITTIVVFGSVSCRMERSLDLARVPNINISEIRGIYQSGSQNGHFGVIHLLESNQFLYEFSNSAKFGYYKGSYLVKNKIILLISDSLIEENWMDKINQIKKYQRTLDSTNFEFVLSNGCLHEKYATASFDRSCTFHKK